MGHTPFGYCIKGGKAFVDASDAVKIRALYRNYLSGLSLEQAAREAGIETYHGSAKRLMANLHYLGDDFYPAIIDVDTFTEAILEQEHRAKALGRTGKARQKIVKKAPVSFRFGEVKAYHDDPAAQAEYLYSLIESEAH